MPDVYKLQISTEGVVTDAEGNEVEQPKPDEPDRAETEEQGQ